MPTNVALRISLIGATVVGFACSAALAAEGDAPAQQTPARRSLVAPELLKTIVEEPNLVYARYGDRQLELDLYRPAAGDGLRPAVVCIHGGGWFRGERASMADVARFLAARGYVAVTITYRLSGEAQFPAQIQDCKAAVRWLRANADKYAIDRNAIGATGLSAGGHLAALLATSGGATELEGDGGNSHQSSTIQAAVAMGAQADLTTPRIQERSASKSEPIFALFLSGTYAENPDAYRLASPMAHLDKSDPPLAFMTGETDDPSTHADEMRSQLAELGIDTELTLISGAPHAFLGKQAWFDQAAQATTAFFDRHLKERSGER